MKKILFIIPALLMASCCTKNSTACVNENDSLEVVTDSTVDSLVSYIDSIANDTI